MDKLIKYLQFNNKESPAYMPNEIFGDLQKYIKLKHVPFTYAYYYLTVWLYRNCKHDKLGIDNKGIKEVLGYSPTYQPIDYIIKKNGVLDEMGYTSTEKDYPIKWNMENKSLDFEMLSEMDKEDQKYVRKGKSRKYAIKLPVKAFHRYGDNDLNGTFYEVDNTHEVPFEIFIYCMSNEKIGCTGFYLWCYLKMKNQIHSSGYDVGLSELSKESGVSKRSVIRYINLMRQYKMIDCHYNQEFYCVALKEEDRKANTYFANEFEEFSDKPVTIKKMQFVTVDDYEKMQEQAKNTDVAREKTDDLF